TADLAADLGLFLIDDAGQGAPCAAAGHLVLGDDAVVSVHRWPAEHRTVLGALHKPLKELGNDVALIPALVPERYEREVVVLGRARMPDLARRDDDCAGALARFPNLQAVNHVYIAAETAKVNGSDTDGGLRPDALENGEHLLSSLERLPGLALLFPD